MSGAHDARVAQRVQAMDRHVSRHTSLSLDERGRGIPEGWFLGPKAENEELLAELIGEAVRKHVEFRRAFHPEDPIHITEEVKRSAEYRETVRSLKHHAGELFDALKHSAPLASMRHQGHMLWDQALPAVVGYFGAMLYNQNNVAFEASPVTTRLEIEVGDDLCRMVGLSPGPKRPGAHQVRPWGHITCDGSVANIEGLWAARNAKFFPVSLRAALREAPAMGKARNLEVRLLDGTRARLIDLDTWVLLNLALDEVVDLPSRIQDEYGIPVAETMSALRPLSVQNVGLVEFYQRFMSEVPCAPVALVPATRHYSWPKAAALLGLGQNNLLSVHVDLHARMDVAHLGELLQGCLQKHAPVIAVVAVIGSTEESSVDPLRKILDLREHFRQQGLNFSVHCDAAWGGYFNTLLRPDEGDEDPEEEVPVFQMSAYVREQYRALAEADSITVDPHKAGYVPYPAGALCYRNSATRDLISLRSPVVFHGEAEPTVGVYGVEGSKPGAAAAAVFLAHKVIPPTRSGYGRILGECLWTSKRLYSRLVAMTDDRLRLTFLQMLPAERDSLGEREVERQRQYIRKHFVDLSNDRLRELLRSDREARDLFMQLGSDQVILTFSFNFVDRSGTLNTDPVRANQLNDTIFKLCSMTDPGRAMNETELILTSSSFDPLVHGQPFVDHHCRRMGVEPRPGLPISFLISTTMDPWTTELPGGGNFLQVVEEALRRAAHRAIEELRF